MDSNLYRAAQDGEIKASKQTKQELELHQLLTPDNNTVLHIHITALITSRETACDREDVVTINDHEQNCEGSEFNPFDESDDKIIERICTKTHVDDADEPFKCYPLFLVVKNILEHSSQFLDEEIGEKPEKDKTRGRVPRNINFNLPLLVLQHIAAENQTEPKVNSHTTTLRILEKLQQYYSWEAKAVLTLLAFAMEFRDFSCPLYQIPRSSTDHHEVSQSLKIIKNVLVFTRSSSSVVQKSEERVHGELEILNNCIKTIVQVMEAIIKLEKLSSIYDRESHSLTASRKALVVHLIGDNKLQDDLENYTKKMQSIWDSLTKKLNALNEEAKFYWDVIEISTAPNNITEILAAMCKPTSPAVFYESTTVKKYPWVDIDPVMKGKATFIFISALNISDSDISLMKQTQKEIDEDTNSKFRIVWIPFSEASENQGTKDMLMGTRRKSLTRYDMVIWPHYRPLALRYIKEEWNYKGQTMLHSLFHLYEG